MIIERAKQSDFQELKQLWSIVFDEQPDFLEHFFSTRIFYDHIFVARVEDKIVSALHALPISYHKGGMEYPCSYIVGAATYKEFRKRGIMSKLLEATKQAYDHPITLFPAVRPFYESNGYFTTSNVLSFDLKSSTAETMIESEVLSFEELNAIYTKATAKDGALVRDEKAWEFLTEGYQTLAVAGAYAFLSEEKAVETMAKDIQSSEALLRLLQAHGITTVQTLPDSPIASLFPNQKGVPIPMGMSTDVTLQGIYISEQY